LNTSERFLRFANECEDMAHLSPTPVNKLVWRNLAHRWRRCAELTRGDDATAYIDRLRKRHFKAAHERVTAPSVGLPVRGDRRLFVRRPYTTSALPRRAFVFWIV
jgi:hypothetical protein